MSSRRLAVLLRHLPPDSALARDRHGEAAEWSVTDHLLAAAVDHLSIGNWMFSAVHRDEDAEMPEAPEAVPRPGVRDGVPETIGDDSGESRQPLEFARFFGQ